MRFLDCRVPAILPLVSLLTPLILFFMSHSASAHPYLFAVGKSSNRFRQTPSYTSPCVYFIFIFDELKVVNLR